MRKLFKKILTFGLAATMTLSSFIPVSAANKDFLSYTGTNAYKTKDTNYGIITNYLHQTNDLQCNFIAGIYENYNEFPVGRLKGETRPIKIGYTSSYAFMRRGKMKLVCNRQVIKEAEQRIGEISDNSFAVVTKAHKNLLF